jgi:putative acetyltransferase
MNSQGLLVTALRIGSAGLNFAGSRRSFLLPGLDALRALVILSIPLETFGAMLTVRRETANQPDVLDLLAKADERAEALYPAESRHGLSLSALVLAHARFFVARRDNQALGCGGCILLSREEAEIKRLFVDTNARGEGVGGAIVLAIEQAAAEEGIHIVLLETGIKSFEAIRLYKRRGFMERGPFAQYTHDPLSVFMSKSLQSRNNSC